MLGIEESVETQWRRKQSEVEELRTVCQATAQNWREGKKRAVFSFPVSKRRLEWLHLQHDGKQLNGKSLSCHEEHLDLSYANLDPQLQRLLATEGATANAFEDANEIWCRTVTIACNNSELLEVKVQRIKLRQAIERLQERIGHLRSHGLSWEDIYNLYAQPGPQCEHWRNLVAFCQRCIDVKAYLSFQHEFKLLESLEEQKTELQREKRDMEPCDSKEASVAGAVCGLMNASDDSVSVKIAEIDERIVALEVAIET